MNRFSIRVLRHAGLIAVAGIATTVVGVELLNDSVKPSQAQARDQQVTVQPTPSGPMAGPEKASRRVVIRTRIPNASRRYGAVREATPPQAAVIAKLDKGSKPQRGRVGSQALISSKTDCNDITSNGFAPSDSVGAQGTAGSLSASNVNMAWVNGAFQTSSCPTLFVRSLKSFFGVTRASETLFDPQVQYVERAKKFIVLAESSDSLNTDQFLYVGVVDDISRSIAPTGFFYKFKLSEVATGTVFCKNAASDFYDYPKLGIGANALAVTSNNFPSFGSVYGTLLAIRQDQVVNGLAASATCFKTGVGVNTNPSNVLNGSTGGNTTTMLLPSLGSGSGNTMGLKRLTWNGSAFSLATLTSVAMPAWNAPPNAKQPGTSAVVDVLDGRFVSAGTQVGSANNEKVYNSHSVACTVFTAPIQCVKIYKIRPGATVSQLAFYYLSGSNASDATGLFNTSLAFNGKTKLFWTASSSSGVLKPGTNLFEMTTSDGGNTFALGANIGRRGTGICTDGGTRCRWGDYSQTSLAPTSSTSLTRKGSRKVTSYDQVYTGASQFSWVMTRVKGRFDNNP